MRILIISGGSLDIDFTADFLKNNKFDYVIAADAGINHCRKLNLIPDEVYGDFDSAKPEELKCFLEQERVQVHRFPCEKDETDTELTLLAAIRVIKIRPDFLAEKENEIIILGATGTRLDHVLGNIQLLKMALDEGISCCLVDAHNRIRMTDRDMEIKKEEQLGKYVSLLPFTERVTGITLRGFAYEVTDFTLVSGVARGVSNQIEADCAEIYLKSGILLVIESRD